MVESRVFGATKNKEQVNIYRITNSGGAYIELIDYGAAVRSVAVRDKNEALTDVCLGYDSVEEYENGADYLGAAVGRYCNRIANAEFILNEKRYTLTKNDGDSCLHGGVDGWSKRVWKSKAGDNSVTFSLRSEDGDGGFPGSVDATIRYSFNDSNELSIEYKAVSDADTPVNLTNHTYFNLSGEEDILSHELEINAAFISEIGEGLVPTGRLLKVDDNEFDFSDDTPFDFTEKKPIGRDIASNEVQLLLAGGYDHSFVLDKSGFRRVASLTSPKSGITMTVLTDRPALQFYSGNFLNGGTGKSGRVHAKRSALCLETQGFPNAVNVPNFPNTILKAGETFETKTVYTFSAVTDADDYSF